jgi:hypothetical protein
VACHVQSVREQRHRSERKPGANFCDHHERRQHHDDPRAARVPIMIGTEIIMVMLKRRKRIGFVHVDAQAKLTAVDMLYHILMQPLVALALPRPKSRYTSGKISYY